MFNKSYNEYNKLDYLFTKKFYIDITKNNSKYVIFKIDYKKIRKEFNHYLFNKIT